MGLKRGGNRAGDRLPEASRRSWSSHHGVQTRARACRRGMRPASKQEKAAAVTIEPSRIFRGLTAHSIEKALDGYRKLGKMTEREGKGRSRCGFLEGEIGTRLGFPHESSGAWSILTLGTTPPPATLRRRPAECAAVIARLGDTESAPGAGWGVL